MVVKFINIQIPESNNYCPKCVECLNVISADKLIYLNYIIAVLQQIKPFTALKVQNPFALHL